MHSHPQCLPAERYRTLPAWEKPDPVPSSLEQIFPTQSAANGEDSTSISGLCRECAKDDLQWSLSAEGCSFSEQLQLSKKHGWDGAFPSPTSLCAFFRGQQLQTSTLLLPECESIRSPFSSPYLFRRSVVFILSSVLLQHQGRESRPSLLEASIQLLRPSPRLLRRWTHRLLPVSPDSSSLLFPSPMQGPSTGRENVTFSDPPNPYVLSSIFCASLASHLGLESICSSSLCQVPSPPSSLLHSFKNANQAKLQCLHISVAWLSTDMPLPPPPPSSTPVYLGGLKTQPGELDPVPLLVQRQSQRSYLSFLSELCPFSSPQHWGPQHGMPCALSPRCAQYV